MFVIADDFLEVPYMLPKLEDVDNAFPVFIDQYEETELSRLLGYAFYNALVAGVEALPAEWLSITAYVTGNEIRYGNNLFTALVNVTGGPAPTDGSTWAIQPANRWLPILNGTIFNNVRGDVCKWKGMKSMVIPMIYALWTKYNNDTQTSAGIVVNDAENGGVVSPAVRISRAWLTYRALSVGLNYNCDCLYDYLLANSILFNDVVPVKYTDFKQYLMQIFNDPGSMNEFDL